MKTIDLTPLKNNDVEYQKIIDTLAESFKCQWDDAIHESYRRYVWQLQEQSREVHSIRCKAENLTKEMEALEIDEMKKKTEFLCKEADSV